MVRALPTLGPSVRVSRQNPGLNGFLEYLILLRSVKLAKVDATKDEASASEYGVQGFPTIYYFINGSKIEFTGDRSAEGIVSWVEKKILPATTEVSSAEELEKLRSDGNVNLVLFSSDEETVDKFKAHAVSDDDNSNHIWDI
jgi:protein disulfide-isomerase A1